MSGEKNMFQVCGTHSFFVDDKHTRCCECGRKIVYRPHAPEESKKICVRCAAKRMAREGGAPEIIITKEVQKEVEEFLRRDLN